MPARANGTIPDRAQTLKVLALMGRYTPMLMLSGDEDGYGARWSVDGHPVEPAIARFLMEANYIAETGTTEMGARQLTLTDSGARFSDEGLRWWSTLNLLQKLKIKLLG